MASPESIRELLDKMSEQREALLTQAEAMSEEDAGRLPAEGDGEAGWSPKQQLAHLAEMETAYRAWVQRALEEDGADVSKVRGERPDISLEQAQEHSVSELTAQLRRQREVTLDLIRGMRPQDFERTAYQPMFGKLTAMQWLRSYYRHDRMHMDQMAGREPEYRPRYAGGQEPDQRRGARI